MSVRLQLRLEKGLAARLRAFQREVSEASGRSVSMNELLTTAIEVLLEDDYALGKDGESSEKGLVEEDTEGSEGVD